MSEMTPLYRALREVSRTFALSIEQLPRGPRDALTLGYLLLRVSDGLEDYPGLGGARKAELLRLWERVLAGAEPAERILSAAAALDAANPEIRVALQADVLLRLTGRQPAAVRDALLHYVRATTLGMARWQERGPDVRTEADLDDYMHQVAGIVGYLITDVFAAYVPAVQRQRDELLPLAREFGLGLQTVNIVRGLRDDFERGWVFVPREYLEPHGLQPSDLFRPEHGAAALAVVERLAAKAERHLWYGMQYLTRLPRRQYRVRLMCSWPLLFAARTLAVTRGNPRTLESAAKVSRREIRSIMANSLLLVGSGRLLRGYCDCLNPASTAPMLHTALPPPVLPAPHLPRPTAAQQNAPGRRAGGAARAGAGPPDQPAQLLHSPTTSRR